MTSALRTECIRLHGAENYHRSRAGIPWCAICRRHRYLWSRPSADVRRWMTYAQRNVASHPAFAGRVLIPNDPSGCWLFNVGHNEEGYGRIRWQGRVQYAHRFAFRIVASHSDRMPEAVCHRCDNPPCINPEHLRAGTLSDNTAEMWAKGRQGVYEKLTATQVALIRASFRGGRHAAEALGAEHGVSSRTIYRIFDGSVKAYRQPERAAA